MDFEKFLNFSDFIANPEQAIKKAQKMMQEAIQEEKLQLETKARAQEEANKAAYQAAIQALKQQYDEMREAEGLNALQKKVDSYELSTADSTVANLQNEVDRLRKENERLRVERERNELLENSITEHNENQRDAETKTAAIIRNIDNKYGTDIIKTANNQGRILTDNEEYEELMNIADDERLEKLEQQLEEQDKLMNFENPDQTNSSKSNFGFGDLDNFL